MSLIYNLIDDYKNNIFGMRVVSSKANPQSAIFPEARLAAFSFMNQGNDLLMGEGIANAMDATAITPEEWTLFGLISGVYSGYDSGVGEDPTGRSTFGGPSLMVGVSKAIPVKNDELLLGTYFEAGIGFVDSEIDTIYGAVNTSGNANYYGLGTIIRYAVNAGFYTENFFRIGILDSRMTSGNGIYSIKNNFLSVYMGAGINFGYELDLFNARDMFDVYTRYTWGHLVEGRGEIDGQNYGFNTINSHQISLGLRYNFIVESMFSPYLGVRVEHEFSAKSVAKINIDYETTSRSLKGFTGLGEIGVRITPNETLPLTMALNLGGHIGTIEGFDITFDIEYLFGKKANKDVVLANAVVVTNELAVSNKEILANKEDEPKEEEVVPVAVSEVEEAKELEKNINNDNVKVQSIDEGLLVKVGEFLFKVESYQLTDKGKESIKIIIDEINTKYPDKKIIVRGHTDSIGDIKFNQYLSEQRAISIINILKESIESSRISYEGMAYSEPIDTNSTSKGRAKNRRAEIVIVME